MAQDGAQAPQLQPTVKTTGKSAQVDEVNGSANHHRPRKRRRVAIACPNCRVRKIKCDHIVADELNGNMLRGMSKSSQAYIRSLEQRLKKFEEAAAANGDAPQLSSHPPPAPSQLSNWSTTSIEIGSPPVSSRRDSILITASPDIFMGGPSGVSFTQLLLNAMNKTESEKLEPQSLSSPREHPNLAAPLDIFVIPPDARELIDYFFGFHYELSPIFHAPSLLAKFNEVIDCDPSIRRQHRPTLAILNMIFAIAASHRRRVSDVPPSATRMHYDTAMALIGPTLLYDWGIEKVQILLLGARYLQSASSPDECWNVLGLAIRIAYGLELHHAPSDQFDCVTREVRKRVWYSCFVYDQLLSMIYGKPSATSSATSTCPLPEDLDDDCIQINRLLYPNLRTPSMMSFSIQVSKLYRILESATSVADPQLETLVHLDEAFEAWCYNMPEHLKLQSDQPIHDDRVLILALRANMVRIFIHRQSLALTLNKLFRSGNPVKQYEGLKKNMLQNSRHICVRTAEETIQLVARRYERTKNAVGPSWFNLYYLFNAILIVVSHVVDPEYRDDKEALAELDRAMRMIRQMSSNHLSAQRAYAFLSQLLGFMDSSITIDGRRPADLRSHRSSGPLQQAGSTSPDVNLGFHQSDSNQFSLTDLYSFWDITQDLTSNLGSQLESYQSLGTGMWSWEVDEQGGLYPSVPTNGPT